MNRIPLDSPHAHASRRTTKWRALLATCFGVPIAFATLVVVVAITLGAELPTAARDARDGFGRAKDLITAAAIPSYLQTKDEAEPDVSAPRRPREAR